MVTENIIVGQKRGSRVACSDCGKSFGRQADLNRHVRHVHMRRRNFRCPFCAHEFAERGHFTSHVASVHKRLHHVGRMNHDRTLLARVAESCRISPKGAWNRPSSDIAKSLASILPDMNMAKVREMVHRASREPFADGDDDGCAHPSSSVPLPSSALAAGDSTGLARHHPYAHADIAMVSARRGETHAPTPVAEVGVRAPRAQDPGSAFDAQMAAISGRGGLEHGGTPFEPMGSFEHGRVTAPRGGPALVAASSGHLHGPGSAHGSGIEAAQFAALRQQQQQQHQLFLIQQQQLQQQQQFHAHGASPAGWFAPRVVMTPHGPMLMHPSGAPVMAQWAAGAGGGWQHIVHPTLVGDAAAYRLGTAAPASDGRHPERAAFYPSPAVYAGRFAGPPTAGITGARLQQVPAGGKRATSVSEDAAMSALADAAARQAASPPVQQDYSVPV